AGVWSPGFEYLIGPGTERLESLVRLSVDSLVSPVSPGVENQASPAEGGTQHGLGRIHCRPRGERVGVGAIEVAERNAVERNLCVMRGQLKLAGSLVHADGTLVAVWSG